MTSGQAKQKQIYIMFKYIIFKTDTENRLKLYF